MSFQNTCVETLPQSDTVSRWALGRSLGLDEVMGVEPSQLGLVLYKSQERASSFGSPLWEDTRSKSAASSPHSHRAGTLISDSPCFRTVRKKILRFIKSPSSVPFYYSSLNRLR